MNKHPRISIIVPVFNCEKYLNRCIDSILNQTFKDIEIILINDGSCDKSGEICNEYLKVDQRIRVIHKKNEGPGKARNIGIKTSKGEYIGFVDSDDYIEPDMYSELYKSAVLYNSDIAICGYKEIKNDIKNVYPPIECDKKLDKNYIQNVLVRDIAKSQDLGLYSLMNKLYKRSTIINNDMIIDEKISFAEDWFFNIELIDKVNCISGVNKYLYNYLPQPQGLYSKYRKDFFEINKLMRNELTKMFQKYNLTDEEYFIRELRYFNDNIRYFIRTINTLELSRVIIVNYLIDEDFINVCKKIIKLDKESLRKMDLSRKNKILPYIICNLHRNITYLIFKNKHTRNLIMKISEIH